MGSRPSGTLIDAECLSVKLQGLLNVLLCKIPPVDSREEMCFVWVRSFRQDVIENFETIVKSVIVLGPTVEVDLHPLKLRSILRQSQWIVGIPICQILWPGPCEVDAIDAVKQRFEHVQTAAADGGCVKARNQCGAVRADGAE